MRIFLLLAFILFGLGLICAAVPTSILGASWVVWTIAGFMSFTLNYLTDEYRIGPHIN